MLCLLGRSRRTAIASAGVGLLAAVVAGCQGDSPETDSARRPTSLSQSPSSRSPSSGSTETGTAVPVYFATEGPNGKPVLIREFHRVTGDPLTEAARLVAGGGQPKDPDYRTLWPRVEFSSVSVAEETILVQIPGDGFTVRPDGMTRREARLAIQQLVYTLQGVQQERLPVQFGRDSADFRMFGLPTDTAYTAASALRTLNLVNITTPEEGAAASGRFLTVTGVANSFEATVACTLTAGDRQMVTRAFTAEGWMEDRLFPFQGRLPLRRAGTGDVLVSCATDDPSGGAEGPGPSVDTKLITVG